MSVSIPSAEESPVPAAKAAPIPASFLEYVRAMGPGIVVVLTWLGAGDLVDASVAGGTFGYSLMCVLALALGVRWLFVSSIARYELCNQHGESVMQGLRRLHPAFPLFIAGATVLLSHVIGVYMYRGLGESLFALTGWGTELAWGLISATLFFVFFFRPGFRRVEAVFMVFLALLTISLVGGALWSGPDLGAILSGTLGFQLPGQRGGFDARYVAVSLVGAVAGSLANLMYPYFIREKGWNTPAHRKVQTYDLAFGVLALIVLDLSVWVLGAEVLHPTHLKIESLKDLARVLGDTLGPWGTRLFYLGVFSAVASSILGNALGYSAIAVDAYLVWKREETPSGSAGYREHRAYPWLVAWCLFTPLIWLGTAQGSFVPLTVAVNAVQVLLLPILALAMWILTARTAYIGKAYRNGPWENLAMGLFVGVALLGAYGVLGSLLKR